MSSGAIFSYLGQRVLDVAVLFDWSSSLHDDHWTSTLNYVEQFVERLNISPDPKGVHVSIAGYSSSPQIVFNFKAPQNMDYVRQRLRIITRQPGYRRPDKALDLARKVMFTESAGTRKESEKVNGRN